METNTGTEVVQPKSFTRFFPHIARILFGLAWCFFGLLGILHFQPKQLPPPDQMEILGALTKAGYMTVVPWVMMLVGILLLINRFVPLALALIAPIIVGILTYHIAIAPPSIGPGIFMAILELYLAWSYRKAFCPMLATKVTPGGNCPP
jgi:hypothetical protein